jgi:hypothetical protein
VSDELLNTKIAEFTNCDHCQIFRGKYEMWFLLVFLRLILIDANTTQSFITEKFSFKFNNDYTTKNPIFTNEQALSVFSGYAETPGSLKEYLAQVTS